VYRDDLIGREDALRRWFVRDCDPVRAEIDGLDVGWGSVQRWMTSRLPLTSSRRHLDFACGYATFVAQLAWRFPELRIVGLNIDFEGPHALAEALVARAGVAERCEFVRADARAMPFSGESFDSASCFLGLQDIEIGFGDAGVREAVGEAVRVLRPGGILAVADEFPFARLRELLGSPLLKDLVLAERPLDVRWSREVAERAIDLYADGWQEQVRSDDPGARERARAEASARLRESMERQLAERGFYVPFGPIRLGVARKRPC
jgi:ubiquinone/menaquinone biosynthesis C-methylase UbiE